MDPQPKPEPESNPPVPPAGTPPPYTPPPVTPAPEVPPPPQPSGSDVGYSQNLPPPMPGQPGQLANKDERMWAMLIHLSGIVGSAFAAAMIPGNLLLPLILWLVKREGAPFIDDQGKEAVNFQITVTIAGIVFFLLSFVCIGIPLLIALGIFAMIVEIIAAVKSNEGVAYRYPLNIRFIK